MDTEDSVIDIDSAIEESMNEVMGEQAEKVETSPKEIEAEQSDPVTEEKPTFMPKWRKEALEKYATLDPVIKAEVEKRENDIHKGIEQYRSKAQEADSWNQALQPYMPTLQQYGEPPQKVVSYLLNVDHALRNGTPEQKRDIVERIARSAGIDLGQPAQEQEALPPQFQSVIERQNQIERFLSEQQRRAEQSEIQQLNNVVEDFKKNAEHFDSVRQDMAGLLQAGQASTLQEAYDKALWLNPEIREQILAKQKSEEEANRQKAAKAAKASSVASIPKRGHFPSKGGEALNIDDAIRSEMSRLGIS